MVRWVKLCIAFRCGGPSLLHPNIKPIDDLNTVRRRVTGGVLDWFIMAGKRACQCSVATAERMLLLQLCDKLCCTMQRPKSRRRYGAAYKAVWTTGNATFLVPRLPSVQVGSSS